MSSATKKISLWRRAVVFGAMFIFVLGIPCLPGPHHLIFWNIAVVVEAALCATLLPFTKIHLAATTVVVVAAFICLVEATILNRPWHLAVNIGFFIITTALVTWSVQRNKA
jgi:hypothetical protein